VARQNLDPSEDTARSMLGRYAECLASLLGDRLEAVILCGSLAMGSYVPEESDIDQITILQHAAPAGAEADARRCRQRTMDAFDGVINLADVVYRPRDLARPWRTEWDLQLETKHLVTVPEELLRIHDHGRIVCSHGFLISELAHPTREEMIAYDERWRRWNAAWQTTHPEFTASIQADLTPRIAAQRILSRAVWHYYFATGETCFDKHRVADQLRRDVPRYLFQDAVELATRVRKRRSQDLFDGEFDALRGWFHSVREWCSAHDVGAVPVA